MTPRLSPAIGDGSIATPRIGTRPDGAVEFLEDALTLGGILEDYDPAHLEFARLHSDLRSDF